MTVVAERRIASEGVCYGVYCPQSGEVLGYVTASGGGFTGSLGEALQQNGFRLVAAESQPPTTPRADFVP